MDAAAPTATDTDPTDTVEDFVQRHRRRFEVFTRIGWLAKGVVYLLFGATAVAIARQSSPEDEASPQGALGQVLDAPGGRLLLGCMAVGLALYSLWRVASLIVVRGSDPGDWGDRLGYGFSAVFYALLSATALDAAIAGSEPGGSSRVESVSRSLLSNDVGRWLLGIGGVVTIGVGIYFAVRKGAMRGFAEDVAGVGEDPDRLSGSDHAIWLAGVVGWIGRGAVTALVGWFVVRSAVNFDPDEARGFDQALREATSSTIGSVLVWTAALGLVLYGGFCLATFRRRSLTDTS